MITFDKSRKPRGGVYELFTTNNKTYCFDDPDFDGYPAIIDPDPEMFEWLRSQSTHLCRQMDKSDVAYYLVPELYIIWKLRYV